MYLNVNKSPLSCSGKKLIKSVYSFRHLMKSLRSTLGILLVSSAHVTGMKWLSYQKESLNYCIMKSFRCHWWKYIPKLMMQMKATTTNRNQRLNLPHVSCCHQKSYTSYLVKLVRKGLMRRPYVHFFEIQLSKGHSSPYHQICRVSFNKRRKTVGSVKSHLENHHLLATIKYEDFTVKQFQDL
ncbi:BnaC04g32510D [Brassica napus]|uniref:(rape) hypothetical protein n=1 Tax=Brassica napus TaxID=3708 RepID=A0A078IJE9_BRANA|nr:unnamed protein product [Brassica napus]CDY50116.1 BnaC04g32510D [Brassica napus]